MAWSSVAGIFGTFVMTQIELPAAGRLLPSFREWRRIFFFGASSTAGQVLGVINSTAANMLIGRILSPVAVGLYSRAFSMVTLFHQAILQGLSPVVLSNIAMRHREGGDVAALMVKSLTYITALGWPFFSFIALLTFPVMRILFGDQWDAAVPLARLISIAVMIGLLDSTTWEAMQGTGSVGKYAVLQAFTVPMGVILLVLALLYGKSIEAVGWAAIASSIVHVAASLMVLRRLVRLRILGLAGAVVKSAWITVASSIVPAAVVSFMTIGPDHIWLPLIIAGVGAGVGFLTVIFATRHPLADEIKQMLTTGRRFVFR
jgi:O-antigen/teichoic acid export membrane protein